MMAPIDWTAAPQRERQGLAGALRAADPIPALVTWLENARARYGELSPALLALQPAEWRMLLDGLLTRNPALLREAVLFAQLWAPEAMYAAYPDLAGYAALLQASGWGPPRRLPSQVPIWRGGRAASVEELRLGRSWTLIRRVACSFAIDRRLCGVSGRTLVVKAVVPRELIASLVEPVVLAEIVPHAAPAEVEIDGDETDWIMEAAAFQYATVEKMRRKKRPGLQPFPAYAEHVLFAGVRRWGAHP